MSRITEESVRLCPSENRKIGSIQKELNTNFYDFLKILTISGEKNDKEKLKTLHEKFAETQR